MKALNTSSNDGSSRNTGATTGGSATSGSTTGGGSTGSSTGTTTGSTTGSTTTGSTSCTPLTAPATPYRTVSPAEANILPNIVAQAPVGSTIVLNDGIYNIGTGLSFARDGVTLMGRSSNPDLVIIDGKNGYNGAGTDSRIPELVRITGSNVTIANLTLRHAANHIVHIYPPSTTLGNAGVMLTHLKIQNPGEQAVKINANGPSSTVFSDNGTIQCSTIQLENVARPWVNSMAADGCYTGGIDAHQARGWNFKYNRIIGFWCPSGTSEHGIHVWTGSRDTVVENNVIEDCARGIGFGLSPSGSANSRAYSDSPCGGATDVGHFGGRIVNNVVAAKDAGLFASAVKFDTGIGVENACDTLVAHNTVYSSPNPTFAAIDVRFNPAPTFPVRVVNNYLSYRITNRDSAMPTKSNNYETATAMDFVNVVVGNFRPSASNTTAVNQGMNVNVTKDLFDRPRDSVPDLGALEH